jgi:hypothetical protein
MLACLPSTFLVGVLLGAALPPALAAEADLGLVITATPAPVVVDQDLRFSIDLVNHGPDSAEDVTVEIGLPAEVSLVGALSSQGTCEPGPPLICQLGAVGATAPANRVGITVETIANVISGISFAADVVSATPDPLPDNNSATASLSVVELRDSADVVVDIRSAPAPVFTGWQDPEFVILIANNGPASAGVVDLQVGMQELRMVSFGSAFSSQGQCSTALDTCAGFQCLAVLDQLLAVTCDLGGLPSGSTASVYVVAAIDLEAGKHLTVSARAAARDTADSDASNNSSEIDVPIVEMPAGGVPVPDEPLIDVGGIDAGGTGVACFIQTVLW